MLRPSNRKERLRVTYEAWSLRMRAARGQGPEGYVSPSRMAYGALVGEYCYWHDLSRWYRGWSIKPYPGEHRPTVAPSTSSPVLRYHPSQRNGKY